MNTASDTDFLLIGGGFFGYAKEICRMLAAKGRKPIWFEDRPSLDTITKATIRIAPALVAAKSVAYFERITAEVRGCPIVDVLIIKGESISPSSIRKLREAFPRARFTLYFWDSYRNMPKNSPEKVALFDRAFTFDPDDAKADARLTYRPLFFLPEYAHLPRRDLDIDLLFIGTAHSDRYSVLNKLAHTLPASIRFERVLYFPSRLVYNAKRMFNPSYWRARTGEFIFTPLTAKEIQALLSRSRGVIDIERSAQCGLTMRTVEVFGAAKKLVTTNKKITETDIYDPANIAVIDRRRPTLSEEFLATSHVPSSPELLARYSLPGWLGEVLPDR